MQPDVLPAETDPAADAADEALAAEFFRLWTYGDGPPDDWTGAPYVIVKPAAADVDERGLEVDISMSRDQYAWLLQVLRERFTPDQLAELAHRP